MSDFALFGNDLFGDPVRKAQGPLASRFVVPPFSVLDARQGDWQERKRAWLACGIESELGRGIENLGMAHPETTGTIDFYASKRKLEADLGRSLTKNEAAEMIAAKGKLSNPRADNAERKAGKTNTAPGLTWVGGKRGVEELDEVSRKILAATSSGSSIFDPVLCELAYRWFCPDGGQIVDPFAGGSVRGIVAALLGRDNWGCDLRSEQIDANEDQAAEICDEPRPVWRCGDAMGLLDEAPPADLIFTCPPYGDLERYSDDPLDLSTMEYHTFLAAYKRIILRCSQKLRKGGMACFVVGDFRNKKTGNYRGFPADTVNAFREVGMELYNDAILVTAVGSLPIRVGKQFEAGRKLGKTHQNVLVFRHG